MGVIYIGIEPNLEMQFFWFFQNPSEIKPSLCRPIG